MQSQLSAFCASDQHWTLRCHLNKRPYPKNCLPRSVHRAADSCRCWTWWANYRRGLGIPHWACLYCPLLQDHLMRACSLVFNLKMTCFKHSRLPGRTSYQMALGWLCPHSHPWPLLVGTNCRGTGSLWSLPTVVPHLALISFVQPSLVFVFLLALLRVQLYQSTINKESLILII